MDEKQVRTIKEKYSADLRSGAGVSGVGVQKDAEGGFYICVHVDPSVPGVIDSLPKELDGVPVRPQASGSFKAF